MKNDINPQLLTIIEKYQDDNLFWNFAESFSAQIDFDCRVGDVAKISRFLQEAERQYDYLATDHPKYLAALNTNREKPVVIIGQLFKNPFLATGVLSHFATSKVSNLYAPFIDETDNPSSDVVKSEVRDATTGGTHNFSEEVSTSLTNEDEIDSQTIQQPPTPIEDQLRNLYNMYEGRVIRVKTYLIDDQEFEGTLVDPEDITNSYVLAKVVATPDSEQVKTGIIGTMSTWNIEILTGEHRGQVARTDAVSASDRTIEGSTHVIYEQRSDGNMYPRRISIDDIRILAKNEFENNKCKVVLLKSGSGYIGDTDKHDYRSFDPPIQVNIDGYAENLIDSENDFLGEEKHFVQFYMDIDLVDHSSTDLRAIYTFQNSYWTDGIIEPCNEWEYLEPVAKTDNAPVYHSSPKL